MSELFYSAAHVKDTKSEDLFQYFRWLSLPCTGTKGIPGPVGYCEKEIQNQIDKVTLLRREDLLKSKQEKPDR